ncbi:hypothetical protein C5E45_08095 [Nocardia nova]|uniref:HTH merR-type domain-containing protein n=2 Tax=Nocardia nova TaxID=37330 RepID=A0A2S6AUR1_9NOCA|nr:hypothetical protein C5E41_08245 [Nocardia nova]PPJ38933.1 hypothetical protein C5E45_08095 [Nocardia nova]
MSGITARTLRHYDDIGLLTPAHVGSNGYRYYDEQRLLRLQHILVLRELGLGLAEIAEAVDSEPDTLAALKRQYARLLAERDRLGRMAETVARTIAELEGNKEMSVQINRPENLFAGFDHTQYDDEARQRWPEPNTSATPWPSTPSSGSPTDRRRQRPPRRGARRARR